MPTIQTSCVQQTLSHVCLAVILLALTLPVLAQPAPADSNLSIARAGIFYQSYIGPDAAIYSGVAYQPNYRGISGSPFFLSENLTPGTLVYEGLTYTRIPMQYDLVIDQLIIADPKGQLLIAAPRKVQQFTFADHSFTFLTINNTPGYYERLTAGYATLLVRHAKKTGEKIESNVLLRSINERKVYYLYKQDHYSEITSAGELLDLLADKKKELQQFRKEQHLRFKKDPETAMKVIIDHYNQLPH
jgi:hypothetical protein